MGMEKIGFGEKVYMEEVEKINQFPCDEKMINIIYIFLLYKMRDM